MNYMRTALLLAALTALFVLVGGALAGTGGMIFALLFAIAANGFAYWNSDRMALLAAHAVEVDERTAPDLVALVGGLAARAGLPMPRVYIVEDDQPNAFATGRDPQHAAIAVHTGLLSGLSREEVAGVLSHEIAHVKARDTLTMTITATIAGAVSAIAHWGLFFGGGRRQNIVAALALAVLAPIAAMIVQMAISRGREYEADRVGAGFCGNPLWLASALRKISARAAVTPNAVAEAHPAMAPLYIVHPFMRGAFDSLFATHPNIENRIAALEELAARQGIGAGQGASPWRPFAAAGDAPGSWGTGDAGRSGHGPWG